MSGRARGIVLLLALAGLGFASASTWVHYRLLTDPTYVSPCDINATFNCTQAYLSQYGSVWGIPVALGGVIWFALVALLAAGSQPSGNAPAPGGAYIFGLATVGLATILYLGYASFFVLKTACLLCLGTYVCVAGIFVTAGLTTTMPISSLPGRFLTDLRTMRRRPVLLVTAILFVVASASAMTFFPREGTAQQAPPAALPADFEKQFADAWAKQPRIDLGVPAEGAKVLIVKFNDWLCPSCKATHLAYEPIYGRFKVSNPGAVRVVIKDWPWNADCNISGGSLPGHEGSCVAAAAVRMARDRNKADAMIDWLLTNQSMLIAMGQSNRDVRGTIKKQAMTILALPDFDRDYPAKLIDIKRDVSDGAALKVDTTPTFFINGVRVPALEPAVLDLAIRLELGKGSVK